MPAGVTGAGSSVACGECACEVWLVWAVLMVQWCRAGNRADLNEVGRSVVCGKCACEGVIGWVSLLVAVGLLVGAVLV